MIVNVIKGSVLWAMRGWPWVENIIAGRGNGAFKRGIKMDR
jgi:hypothetical protein